MNLPDYFVAAVTGRLKVPGEMSILEEPGVAMTRLSAGQTLCQQGDVGDSMYIVTNGRLRCSRRLPTGEEHPICELGRGEIVGEMCLLTGEARSATVRAIRDTELWEISKNRFDALTASHPQVLLPLARRIIERLKQSGIKPYETSRSTLSALAIIPIGDGAPIREFASRLVEALSRTDSTLRMTSASVDASLWPGASQTPWHHSKNSEVVGWLSRLEDSRRFLVYESDRVWSPWTSRCLRQADRILMVARVEEDPGLSKLEIEMTHEASGRSGALKELVLLHPSRAGLSSGTRHWLEKRPGSRAHHICLDSPEDIQRLVRLLTGKTVGLVLGGGGARCFAQIGVIKAIREARIPIDMVGAVSMGAFVGAQCALGWDPETIRDYSKKIWVEDKVLKDYTIPFLGLVTGKRFKRVMKEVYGSADIEDLPTPFFCITSNLTRAEAMVHQQGPIWRWLCATIAVPGMAPPLFDNGCLLSDGGVMNNLPIDVMRTLSEGTVIAVDVSPLQDLTVDVEYQEPPSAWKILWSRLNPLADRLEVPTIADILSRVTSINTVQAIERLKNQADLYLHPPVDEYSIFDFKLIDELVEVGYRDACKRIEEWRNSQDAPEF